MDKRKLILLGGGAKEKVASIGVTTTAAETLTITALTVITGETLTVNWGDGSSNDYTGVGERTHDYAGAGEWVVTFRQPELIEALVLADAKMTVNSSNLVNMINVDNFQSYSIKAGEFNSSDIVLWNPSAFALYSMPAGYTGTFNSSDIASWRPDSFSLYSMPAGYAGEFNSSDVALWTSSDFRLNSMPAGYAGTFDSSDIASWTPTSFYMRSMPAGYAGTFDTIDLVSWSPTSFRLFSMPVATFIITITANSFDGWIKTTGFYMQGNSLDATEVTQILADFWVAFATRTGAAGTIDVSGTNTAPTGTYQAANPPTTGLEYRYELLNDSQNINPTKKWSAVTVTA